MLIAEYPFETKKYQLQNGHCLSYIELSPPDVQDKKTIVFFHGNPTWSYFFRHAVSHFSKTHRVIAFDHLGMGLSDKPQDFNYTLANHITHAAELLQFLNIQGATFVMHDWGGAIGHGVALSNPSLAGGLVSMNTAAFLSKRIPFTIALCKIPILGEWFIRCFNGFAWPATFMATCKPMSKEVKQGYLFPYQNYHDRIGTSRFVQDIPLHSNHQSFGTLAEIEKGLPRLYSLPKVFIWGEKDFCFTTHFLYRFCQFFPNAKSYILKEAGHYLLEDERERVIALIEEYLHEYRR